MAPDASASVVALTTKSPSVTTAKSPTGGSVMSKISAGMGAATKAVSSKVDAVKPSSIAAKAKKTMLTKVQKLVEKKLDTTYTGKVKLSIAADRRTPWPVRVAIHEVVDEVWENIHFEAVRAFEKMIEGEATEIEQEEGEGGSPSKLPPPSPAPSPPSPPASPPQSENKGVHRLADAVVEEVQVRGRRPRALAPLASASTRSTAAGASGGRWPWATPQLQRTRRGWETSALACSARRACAASASTSDSSPALPP